MYKPSSRLVTIIAFAAVTVLAATTAAAQTPREWSYSYFKEVLPLTLDTYRIAVLDPTPSPLQSSAKVKELRARQGGVPTKSPAGDLGDGWALADLNGTPSGGDPLAVEALIEQIANDPAGDEFASPVFLVGDLTIFVTPRIHVGFNEGVPLATVEQTLLDAGLGSIVESDWIRPNIFVVEAGTRSGIATLDAANALAQLPDVYFATVNWSIQGESMAQTVVEYPPEPILATRAASWKSRPPVKDAPAPLCGPLGVPSPNDPYLTESWGLESFTDIDIDAYGAWAICTGSNPKPVAVIGDGVQADHPDMPNVLPGADFTNECLSPPCLGEPQSGCDNHETIVASIIHAAANNGLGSVGVAPDVSILPVRAGRYWLWGSTCVSWMEQRWLAAALNYAIGQGVSVINLSWNLRLLKLADITIAFQEAYNQGIVSFNSAGNGNETEVYQPGRLFEVHSVSGIDFTGNLFYESDTYASNSGPDVEFTGPGRFIFALDRTGADGLEDETGPYGADAVSVTGTSYASPHIAGIAALIRAINPDLGPPEVAYVLRSVALDLGGDGRDNFFGYGLCKAAASLTLAPSVIAIRDFDRGDLSNWSLVEGGL